MSRTQKWLRNTTWGSRSHLNIHYRERIKKEIGPPHRPWALCTFELRTCAIKVQEVLRVLIRFVRVRRLRRALLVLSVRKYAAAAAAVE